MNDKMTASEQIRVAALKAAVEVHGEKTSSVYILNTSKTFEDYIIFGSTSR